MKFKTKRDSETGKRFEALNIKSQDYHRQASEVARKYGATKWTLPFLSCYGGIASIIVEDESVIDQKHWKKSRNIENAWLPRLSTRVGKRISKEFEALPFVDFQELNKCVGFEGDFFTRIGFSFKNPDWFLFSVKESWNFTPPEDCIEITVKEYKELSAVSSLVA